MHIPWPLWADVMEPCEMTWIKMERVQNEYPPDRDVYTHFLPAFPFPSLPNAAYYAWFSPPDKWILKLCGRFLTPG